MENLQTPIMPAVGNEQSIAYCGLYCKKCPALKSGKCDGCRILSAKSATLYKKCRVKPCCEENGFFTCADCTIYSTTKVCKKYNPLLIKIVSWIESSDRSRAIEMIKSEGRAGLASFMEKRNWVCFKVKDTFFNKQFGDKVNEK